jgi:hypothetical protein
LNSETTSKLTRMSLRSARRKLMVLMNSIESFT